MDTRGIFSRLLDPEARKLEGAVYDGVVERGGTVTLSRTRGKDITIGTIRRSNTGNVSYFWKIEGRKAREIGTWFGVLGSLFRYEYTDIKYE